jgi:hypothetical protein
MVARCGGKAGWTRDNLGALAMTTSSHAQEFVGMGGGADREAPAIVSSTTVARRPKVCTTVSDRSRLNPERAWQAVA